LFKQGKTIQEIATERNMAITTIEGHLAEFAGTGEVDIHQLISDEKIKIVAEYFKNNESTLLGPAKVALGDEISWGELRLVLNYLSSQKK